MSFLSASSRSFAKAKSSMKPILPAIVAGRQTKPTPRQTISRFMGHLAKMRAKNAQSLGTVDAPLPQSRAVRCNILTSETSIRIDRSDLALDVCQKAGLGAKKLLMRV